LLCIAGVLLLLSAFHLLCIDCVVFIAPFSTRTLNLLITSVRSVKKAYHTSGFSLTSYHLEIKNKEIWSTKRHITLVKLSKNRHYQTWPVFYGTQPCVKVWKDLVERYFNYYPETKSVTNRHEETLYTPNSYWWSCQQSLFKLSFHKQNYHRFHIFLITGSCQHSAHI
jgi:hypothetical protein